MHKGERDVYNFKLYFPVARNIGPVNGLIYVAQKLKPRRIE